MDNLDMNNDHLPNNALDYDLRASRIQYVYGAPWPMLDQNGPHSHDITQRRDMKREISPVQTTSLSMTIPTAAAAAHSANLMSDWQFQQPTGQLSYPQDGVSMAADYSGTYGVPLQTSPIAYTQAQMDPTLRLDNSYMPLPDQLDPMAFNWPNFPDEMIGFGANGLPEMSLAPQPFSEGSPTDTFLEVRSLTSSSSDNGWATVDYTTRQAPGAIFNPSQTLHNRTFSDSSYSDLGQQSRRSFSSFVEVPPFGLNSPGSDSNPELDYHRELLNHTYGDAELYPATFSSISSTASSPPAVAVRPVPSSRGSSSPQALRSSPPALMVRPMPHKQTTSPQRSPGANGSGSPTGRRASRKSPIAKTTKASIKKPAGKDGEKKIGRRKGPLRPDQRKQASEIRKLRACLRCKFLKKTCDKGEPCAGCQPSHARLWQVPCTRIDIKEIGFFVKDWKADYERHVSLGFSVSNIKGFSDTEQTLFITHGYGQILPVKAREVFVRDDSCFDVTWTESAHHEPRDFEVPTARLSAGVEGISTTLLSEYLDRHIDGGFEHFVDDYFEGTPFLTQMLKTAYHFYVRTQLPIVKKALKLVLAYNLTVHVTMIEGIPDEESLPGKIMDDSSKFKGKTMAPVMINFQVKMAMANMWRELQKDVLEELSALYSSVYSGDKLKHWPTIFMLACLLLAVWENMQFDCKYRIPDEQTVEKFCSDMETIPVGVIVGLFSAISQKLPSFLEWDSRKHHQILNSDPAVCDAMTEVREHVTRYETYLRTRSHAKFDRRDFDSLSNKFLSKLVIRAN
ncbi:MAG: hypothetical protein M1834_002993 [Cirrosporium novae-zelandiae]|nr:MAG: hypothetical protein M1834_002993 [Cirrosporium novae-zelandiae]